MRSKEDEAKKLATGILLGNAVMAHKLAQSAAQLALQALLLSP